MKQKTIRTQFYVLLMCLSFLSILSIGSVVCTISYRNVMSMSVQTCNQLVDKTVDELNFLLEGMNEMPAIIGRDSRVQKAMRKQFDINASSDMLDVQYEISAFLSEMNRYDNNIFCIYAFLENGISSQSKFYRLTMEDLSSNKIYLEACEQGKTIWYPPSKGSEFSITTGESLISTVTPIKEIGSGKYVGAVVIELEEARIKDCIDVGIGKSGFLYICDENGIPIVYPDGKDVQMLSAWARYDVDQEFSDGLLIRRGVGACGWSLIGIIPQSDLNHNTRSLVFVTIVFCLLLLSLSLYTIVRVTDHILCRIDILNQKMSEMASGNLSVQVNVTRQDEIGLLMVRFNEMVQQIRELMRREAESQRVLRQTELKALQAQIKPHFLYNTLDSIIWMARAQDQDGVIQIVLALTNFLKIGLSNGEEIITLEQEIKHTTSYLEIQSIRYKGKFDSTITVDESVKNYLVPKLIVQPLVENAIYHGMKMKRELCHLKIWAGERGEHIVIEVKDDGVGMTSDAIQALQDSLYGRTDGLPSSKRGYGVANVNERIQIMNGPSFGITFESVLGEGSVFQIILPKNKEKDQ